jgi:hypothetical protein
MKDPVPDLTRFRSLGKAASKLAVGALLHAHDTSAKPEPTRTRFATSRPESRRPSSKPGSPGKSSTSSAHA